MQNLKDSIIKYKLINQRNIATTLKDCLVIFTESENVEEGRFFLGQRGYENTGSRHEIDTLDIPNLILSRLDHLMC